MKVLLMLFWFLSCTTDTTAQAPDSCVKGAHVWWPKHIERLSDKSTTRPPYTYTKEVEIRYKPGRYVYVPGYIYIEQGLFRITSYAHTFCLLKEGVNVFPCKGKKVGAIVYGRTHGIFGKKTWVVHTYSVKKINRLAKKIPIKVFTIE